MRLETLLTVLNQAAYLAASAAIQEGDPRAEALRSMALDTDALILPPVPVFMPVVPL